VGDCAYHRSQFERREIEHRYGPRVHILSDPTALTLLARLCAPQTGQPAIGQLVRHLYTRLIHEVVNDAFPRKTVRVDTRMRSVTERGVFEGEVIDEDQPVVSVALARAGILPSQVCYDYLNDVMNPAFVRQDHLVLSRVTDASGGVTGAAISGNKVGGPIDGRIVLFPDPMGATGSSLARTITFLKEAFGESPGKLLTLNLIVTPEFIRCLAAEHPEVEIYALRLDRGMSSEEVLSTVPGELWDQESGLTSSDYIVPGGGGFGEIMNNAWV
jgi:uracil phosphoribosyltransferase